MSEPLIWEGRELRTMGDTMDAVLAIVKSGSAEKAAAFLEVYGRVTPHAKTNIGYGAGYYDQETASKIFELFDCRHPMFGRTFPSPEWAFELGKRRATGGKP